MISFSFARSAGFALVLVGLLAGCSKTPDKEEVVAPPQLTSETPLTDDRRLLLEGFGRKLVASVRESDSETFEKLFSHRRFGELTVQGMKMPSARFKKDFLKGFMGGITRNAGGVAASFLGQPCKFLRVIECQGQHRVLCRLYGSKTGLNYHAYACEVSKDGRVRAIDFYNFISGEEMSLSVRRFAIQAIAGQQDQSFVERMFSKQESLLAGELDNVKRLSEAAQGGDIDEGLKIYESLPKALQKDKSIMNLWRSLLGVREEDEAAYADALKLYADTFPGDPSLKLLMFDYHFLKEDYAKAFASLDAIEEEVGPDAALDVLRASVARTQTDYENALRLAEKAIRADPMIEDAYWSAINAASPLEDHASMLSHLVTLRDSFDYVFDPEELRAEELYRKFMDSPEAAIFFGEE